ncbi:hypothetical protein ODV12_06070 [Lactobacillus amylovorus]|uniref:hypothetical protein n=1 Tax=Lactobacillus amylovorus TaxID=1604 RepID=UPI00232BF0D1|nr:hypothetical protein [Lactobacillus amylovorus]MDB6250797.1 hypothetical protein [Lactobacillus amylovorus]
MNNEKFAHENKRIIKGMGLGVLVGPLILLALMYLNHSGSLEIYQIIISIAVVILGAAVSASLAVNKTVDAKISWQKKVLKLAPQVVGTGLLFAVTGAAISLLSNWGSVDVVKAIFSNETLNWFIEGIFCGLITTR